MNADQNNIERFCFSADLSTYDPYDIWKHGIGFKVKKLYNNHKYLATIPAAILTLYDHVLNNERRFFYRKQEFPIVRASAAQSLLNIYQKNKAPGLLPWVKIHLDWLLHNYSRGYSGYCWGMNMKWASKIGTYRKDTPFITHTPYVLEALIRYQEVTRNHEYQHAITSVYDFISKDLYKLVDEENVLCLSYAPGMEVRPVVNANSYALYCLSLLLPFLPAKSEIIQNDIIRLYNFIIQRQNQDGSWFYYGDDRKENFIDCFHTCFVLKNLIKASKNGVLPNNHTLVIERGYQYLLNNFIDKDFMLVKRFVKTDKPNLVKFDLYDNAEILNLSYLYDDPNMYMLLKESITKHFIRGEDIYSTINLFNNRKNKNMLRWALMPYLHALSHSIN